MKVPVGAIEYDVVFVDGLRSDDDDKLYGHVSFPDQVISIDKKYADKGRFPVILMHEIIHAVVDDRVPSDLDENVVLALANGLTDTLMRCPDLLDMLREYGKAGTNS